MMDLGDHAAGRGRIRHLGDAADPVQPEPDQGLALSVMTANRAAGLLDLDGLCAVGHGALPVRSTDQSATCSASAPASRRRACKVDTLMLRRAATARGESWRLSASNVARTML